MTAAVDRRQASSSFGPMEREFPGSLYQHKLGFAEKFMAQIRVSVKSC